MGIFLTNDVSKRVRFYRSQVKIQICSVSPTLTCSRNATCRLRFSFAHVCCAMGGKAFGIGPLGSKLKRTLIINSLSY